MIPSSKYSMVGKLPLRMILLGPSAAGKGVLLQNMILDIYRGCFERVFIWSPSINLDDNWKPVKEYLNDDKLMPNKNGDKLYYDECNHDELAEVIEKQRKVVEYQKSDKQKKLFQILIIIDDFADDPIFSRHSRLLHSLFTRGRHTQISTIVSTQKYNAISPTIRVNATELIIFKLRSNQDLNIFLEENGALLDKNVLLQVYIEATKEPYSFLYIKLKSHNINDMFYIKFDKRIRFDE